MVGVVLGYSTNIWVCLYICTHYLSSHWLIYLNNQGLGKCYQPWPWAWLITLTSTSMDITKTSSNIICFIGGVNGGMMDRNGRTWNILIYRMC